MLKILTEKYYFESIFVSKQNKNFHKVLLNLESFLDN